MNPPQQPQQAYQPQPEQQQQQHAQQQQQMGQYWPQPQAPDPRAPPYTSSKAMWTTKLLFRVLSAIFNIVLIGLSATVGVRWNESRYASWGLGALIITIPVVCLPCTWV